MKFYKSKIRDTRPFNLIIFFPMSDLFPQMDADLRFKNPCKLDIALNRFVRVQKNVQH